MIIRVGFVSNSSSSSFVVVIESEEFNRVMKAVHPYVKEIIEAIGVVRKKFIDIDVVMLSMYGGQGGDSTLDNLEHIDTKNYREGKEDEDHDEAGPYEALDDFLKEINNDKMIEHERYN